MSQHQLLMLVPVTWTSQRDLSDEEVKTLAVRAFEGEGMPNCIVHRCRRVETLDLIRTPDSTVVYAEQ